MNGETIFISDVLCLSCPRRNPLGSFRVRPEDQANFTKLGVTLGLERPPAIIKKVTQLRVCQKRGSCLSGTMRFL